MMIGPHDQVHRTYVFFLMMPKETPTSKLLIHSSQRTPQPILPVDYSFFLSIPLPPDLATMPLAEQLASVKQAIQGRRQYPFAGPFGPFLAHEFQVTPNLSIYLNKTGDFAGGEVGDIQSLLSGQKNTVNKETMTKGKKDLRKPKQYVIGRRAEGFCWLLPDHERDQPDDQDLDLARRFESLAAAVQAAAALDVNVFEIGQENGREVLHELTVDLALAESLPYRGCYRVSDLLLAGPMFATESSVTTLDRITALSEAKVWGIVSLVDRGDLFWMQSGLDPLTFQRPFQQHCFPIRNGEAPSHPQMRVILNIIDKMIEAGHRVFVHCLAGRGRTGAVIGCWLARHREPNTPDALDELARMRYLHGLFQPSPETETQRAIVRNWKKDE